jgi:hypothetical protein
LVQRVYNTVVKANIDSHWKLVRTITAALIVILLAGLIARGLYLHSLGVPWADWTGFGDYRGPLLKDARAKTLWDWMGLLLVPIGVGLAATFWSYFQQRTVSKRADIRAALEREIALGRQREEAMRSYFDKIGQLLMEKDLLKTRDIGEGTKEAAIRDYAQILTITVLRSLDVDRKNMVLQFLRDANLAGFILASASLAHSDLKNTNFYNINLKLANLNGAILNEAILSRADLAGAYLGGADLNLANLVDANLTGTNLTGAVGITEEQISQAILNETIMPDGSVRSNNQDDKQLKEDVHTHAKL